MWLLKVYSCRQGLNLNIPLLISSQEEVFSPQYHLQDERIIWPPSAFWCLIKMCSPASAACCIRYQTECPGSGTRVCPLPPVSCWPPPPTPWPASWSWPLLSWSSPCCHRSHCRDCSRELSDSAIISRWKTLLITHNHFPHLPKGINVAINKVIISPSQESITNWKLGPHHQRNVTLTY